MADALNRDRAADGLVTTADPQLPIAETCLALADEAKIMTDRERRRALHGLWLCTWKLVDEQEITAEVRAAVDRLVEIMLENKGKIL